MTSSRHSQFPGGRFEQGGDGAREDDYGLPQSYSDSAYAQPAARSAMNENQSASSRYASEGYSQPTTYTASGPDQGGSSATSGSAADHDYPSSRAGSSQATSTGTASRRAAADYSATSVAPSVSTRSTRNSGYSSPTTVRSRADAEDDNSNSSPITGVRSNRRTSARTPRRAQLQLRNIDPMSMLRLSLLFSCAAFVVWMVAVGVIYGVLAGMGVFSSINSAFGGLSGGGGLVTPGLVFGGAAIIGVINIVLFTAMATVGSYLYNVCSDVVGGVEVTLAEKED